MLLVMRASLELLPGHGDRLEGRIFTDDGRVDLTFSGTLDLLRAIEELQQAGADAASAGASSIPVTASPFREESR